ncbi:hypothetical protein TB1_024748 [Malus domestica]
MSTFTLHSKANLLNLSSSPRMYSQRSLLNQVSSSLLRSSPAQFKYKHVEIYFFKSKSTSYHKSRRQRYLMACCSFNLALACKTRRKKEIDQHLENLNKETDHHLYLVPVCRVEETKRRMQSAQSINPAEGV